MGKDLIARLGGCHWFGYNILAFYLRVLLGGNLEVESFWDLVVKRISRRLECWKDDLFSWLKGYFNLVCLSGILLYYFHYSRPYKGGY